MNVNSPDEPVLRPYQGASFKYAMPAGWRARETSHGVDLLAPDGLTAVSFSVLAGAAGREEPLGFIGWMLQQLGVTDARFLTVCHPAASCCEGGWQMTEVEAAHSFQGTAVRSRWTCALRQDGGHYTAVLWGCQAPGRNWDRRSQWLPRVAESIVLVNRVRVSLPHSAWPLPALLQRSGSPGDLSVPETAG